MINDSEQTSDLIREGETEEGERRRNGIWGRHVCSLWSLIDRKRKKGRAFTDALRLMQ